MIGIDTNVLVRAVVLDDPGHGSRATRFLAARTADDPAYVNPVVTAELVWVLRSKYRMPRATIAEILRDMIESSGYVFGERRAVLRALFDYEAGIGQFTDRLIAEINDAHGCARTLTFDAGAAKRPPFARMP